MDTQGRHSWWPILGGPLAVLLSLLGLALSALLLQHHVVVAVGGDPLLSGVCEMTEHSSCDAVLRSEWGTFHGVPTALWGFWFFAAIFSWYVVIGQPAPERRWWHVLPVAATAAGTGICAGLAFLMYTRLPAWCPLCAATHVVTALLFVVTALLWPRGEARSAVVIGPGGQPTPLPPGASIASALDGAYAVVGPTIRPSLRQMVVAVLLAGAVGAAGSGEYYRRLHKGSAAEYKRLWQVYESDLQMVYNRFMAEPKVDIPIGPDDSVLGPAAAPHTAVVFADFQCEYCRAVSRAMKSKVDDNPGHLRLVFKHFPMNKDCNQYVTGKTHVAACAAAVTAEAARKVGGDEAFWKMHDELFSHQASFARKPWDFLKEACGRIGIDDEQVRKNIATRSAWSRVNVHTAEAHAIGVNSTPAVYLDGRRLNAWALDKFWTSLFAQDVQSGRVAARPATQPAAGGATRPSQAPIR